jgi:hypothetical protein
MQSKRAEQASILADPAPLRPAPTWFPTASPVTTRTRSSTSATTTGCLVALVFQPLRRAVGRYPDGMIETPLAFFTLDITHVTVESHE